MTTSTISVRELRNNTGEIVRRVEAGEVLHVTVHGKVKMELRAARSTSWLDDLREEAPESTGWLDELMADRDADIALQNERV